MARPFICCASKQNAAQVWKLRCPTAMIDLDISRSECRIRVKRVILAAGLAPSTITTIIRERFIPVSSIPERMALCLLGAKSAGLSSVGYFLATLDIGLRQIGPLVRFVQEETLTLSGL